MESHFAGTKGSRVVGVGPLSAPVVILGEAPGKDEEAQGEPFVGASGQFLWHGRDWGGQTKWQGLERLGLPRAEVRIENVLETRPPDNRLDLLSPATVAKAQEEWWRRLEKLGPTLIVPVGNLALNTLRRAPLPLTKRGTWKVKTVNGQKQINWRDKIHNWRGSVFNVRANSGTKVKVIPTYHPAFILRAEDAYDAWQGDWGRILGDRHFPELRRDPKCEHMISPTLKDSHAFEMLVHQTYQRDQKRAVLAVDIETVGNGVVDCIGFSVDEEFSMTYDIHAERNWWGVVNRLLVHPIAKGWHYGLFDCFVLGQKGKRITNTRWDSQQMHHCLDPRDEHRLGYCASRDLRVRFWKTEAKEDGQAGVRTKDRRQFLRYNGKDAAYTRALIERYRERLRSEGLLPIYRDHYRRLSAACLRLTQTGFAVDETARREIEQRERAVVAATRSEMATMAGGDLVAKGGGLSPVKVNAYFYDTLKCKPFFKRGSGRRTADELAIRRLMHKYKKARPGGALILAYRQHTKIAQEVRETIVSADGRLRSRYSPTTDTGRLRAMKVSDGEGINAQNRDRHSDLRRMFVADPGHILLEWDQSQGESRIVDGMSGDPKLLKLARMLPTEIDQHILNAAKVFGVDYDDLLKAYKAGDPDADMKRQLGKRVRHACNYGMQGKRMAEIAMVETESKLILDPDECDEWLETMKKATPGIEKYQGWIRQQMIETGRLTSSWGRFVDFKGLRLSKEDYKAGYAWLPQHEVGVDTNILAFVPLDDAIYLEGRFEGALIVQQGHDSLASSAPVEHAYDVAKFVNDNFTVERTYPGAGGPWTLAMPIGLKVGHNWKDMTEFKSFPSRKEFYRCLEHYTSTTSISTGS